MLSQQSTTTFHTHSPVSIDRHTPHTQSCVDRPPHSIHTHSPASIDHNILHTSILRHPQQNTDKFCYTILSSTAFKCHFKTFILDIITFFSASRIPSFHLQFYNTMLCIMRTVVLQDVRLAVF